MEPASKPDTFSKISLLAFSVVLVITVVLLIALFLYNSDKSSEQVNSIHLSGAEITSEQIPPTFTQELENANVEINAPRGVVESYDDDNGVLYIKNASIERAISIPLRTREIEITCIEDNRLLPDGKPFSVFDAYVDIGGYHMFRGNKLFPEERAISIEQAMSIPEREIKVIYALIEMDAMVEGGLDGKLFPRMPRIANPAPLVSVYLI